MIKKIMTTLILTGLWASTAYGQQALTTGADFLLMTTGARPDAMGQAFSAVADDINTLTFNPAGLGNIREPEVGYGHESFVSNINYDFIGSAFPIGGLGVLGFGYINMGSGAFNSTANPLAVSSSVDDQAFIAGLGKSFYNLHVGFAVKYITEQIDTVQGNGFGFDLGFRYRLLPMLTIAASALNIGNGIQLASLEPLPTVIDTGIAWSPFDSPDHSLTLASDAICNITTNTQKFGFGGEYWFHKTFALRAGYLLNSLDPTDTGFSAGAGVQVAFFQLDYALEPFSTEGIVNRFSGILRWDGPWVSGGEPNAPRFVTCEVKIKSLEIRWEKPEGPVTGYEVLVQPLNGEDLIVSGPVTDLTYEFQKYEPDTLYKISVRSIGEGNGLSFPAKEAYVETNEDIIPAEPRYGDKGEGVSIFSATHGVDGQLDAAGLRLSWDEPKGVSVAGYNLYRKSTDGRVEKVTLAPKKNTRVWITDIAALQGSEWIVTAVVPNSNEKQIGSFLWYPSITDLQLFNAAPTLTLSAEPEPSRKIYLDWDNDPLAASYTLLIDRSGDGIYEPYKSLDKTSAGVGATVLLQMEGKNKNFSFVIVSKDDKGNWLKRSNEAKVELFEDPEEH